MGRAWILRAARLAQALTALLLAVTLLHLGQWLAALVAPETASARIVAHYDWRDHSPPASEPSDPKERQRLLAGAQVRFTLDGEPHFYWFHWGGETGIVTLYDRNLKQIWQGSSKEVPYEYIGYLTGSEYILSSGYPAASRSTGAVSSQELESGPGSFSYRLEYRVFAAGSLVEMWRYNPTLDLLEGFELGGRRIGFIGRSGFKEGAEDALPFGGFKVVVPAALPDETVNVPLYWLTESSILTIDPAQRRVDAMLDVPAQKLKHVVGFDRFNARQTSSSQRQGGARELMVVTLDNGARHVFLLDPPEEYAFSERDTGSGSESSLWRFSTAGGKLWVTRQWTTWPVSPGADSTLEERVSWRERRNRATWDSHHELWQVLDAGQLELVKSFKWTYDPELRPESVRQPDAKPRLAFWHNLLYAACSPGIYQFTSRLSAPSRFLQALARRRIHRHPRTTQFVAELVVGNMGNMIGGNRNYAQPWLAWPATLICLFLANRHARRRHRGRAARTGWLLVIALFNTAGLLAYLATNHTRLIKCPDCGSKRAADVWPCSGCGQPLGKPKPVHHCLILPPNQETVPSAIAAE